MTRKNLLVLVFTLLIINTICAQKKSNSPEPCASETLYTKMLELDPSLGAKRAQFEEIIKKNKMKARTSGSIYIVPIVIHVMHKGEPLGSGTNISDDQVRAKIQAINQEFRKIAGTQGDGAGVDIGIEFALAVVDPSGNPTNGIVRYDMSACASADCIAYMNNGINGPSGTTGIPSDNLKALSHWDSHYYYNFWLVSEIDNNNGGAGTQGFAAYPGNHGSISDGTVVMSNAFKNLRMTVESHELGHAFNLFHTFQGEILSGSTHSCPPDDPTQGDMCADTAPHISDIKDCSANGTNSCDTGAGGTGAYSRFINNYMSYSYDSCRNMFTNDQKTRMIATLIGPRSSFLSTTTANNLVPLAAPICNFSPSQRSLIMTGESINFIDSSANIPNTYIDNRSNVSSSWNVSNGITNLVSSNQNPKFTFAQAGNYGVSLTSTNAIGSHSKNVPNNVLVTDPVVASSAPVSKNIGNFGSTIYQVNFKDILNITSFVGNQFLQDGVTKRTDFTSTNKTILNPGETAQLSIALNSTSSSAEYFAAYIDYNNDGNYTVDEKVAEGNMPATTNTCAVLDDCSIKTNITIPATATKNKLLRMRIIGSRSAVTLANMNGTSIMTIGDVEDYGIYIFEGDILPSISYSSPNIFTVGTAISNLNPNNTGGVATGYTVSPNLPAGLSLNASTGVISGTPTLVQAQSTYTVTATNGAGNSTFEIAISVSGSLGTENPIFKQIKVYPNPVKDILSINSKTDIERIEVYNLLGQLVYFEQCNDFDFNTAPKLVDFSKLDTGMYFIILFANNEKSSYKILKN